MKDFLWKRKKLKAFDTWKQALCSEVAVLNKLSELPQGRMRETLENSTQSNILWLTIKVNSA